MFARSLVSRKSFCSKEKCFFHALVIPNLMYALDVIWLNQCQRKRLDSFYVGCIRQIVKIQHAYYSRISNEDILKAAHSSPFSLLLICNQLKSFGRIASLDYHNCVREMIFEPNDSFTLRSSSFQRKQGRPRLSWASEVFKIAIQVSSSIHHLQSLLRSHTHSPREWLAAIGFYLYSTTSID